MTDSIVNIARPGGAIGDPTYHQELAETLSEYRNEDLVYCPNPGNAGDSLIAAGTYEFFSRINLRPRVITLHAPADLRGATLLYGGGGLLVPFYETGIAFLSEHLKSLRRLIILPHTIFGHEDFIRSLPATTHVFVREQRSFQEVASAGFSGTLHQSHDLALQATPDALTGHNRVARAIAKAVIARVGGRSESEVPVGLVKRPLARYVRDALTWGGPLRVMRGDVERHADTPRDEQALDLSARYTVATDPWTAPFAAGLLMTHLRSATTVATDRLHVAIAAAMLGKPTRLLPNAYFKNEAVYEHTLSAASHVTFER